MSEIQTLFAIVLILLGILLMFTGSIGILRLPDFYCRAHASGKADTLGIMVLLAGLAVYEGMTLTSAKVLMASMMTMPRPPAWRLPSPAAKEESTTTAVAWPRELLSASTSS